MFGFKKKDDLPDEINRLLTHLEKNPGDTESRLTLGNLYLQAGDQETAIKEYHAVAKELRAEGLNLEPIAIYKKILDLQGISLTKGSQAAVQQAEEFLEKATKAYEEAFQIEPQGDEVDEPSEPRQGDRHETRDDLEKEEIPCRDDPETVAAEVTLDLAQDQAIPTVVALEDPGDHPPDHELSSLEPSLSDGPGEPNKNAKDQEPLESLDAPFSSPDIAPDEREVQTTVHDPEITPETDSSYLREDLQIDANTVQIDDDLETILVDHESEPSSSDFLSPAPSGAIDDENLLDIPSGFQKSVSREKPSPLDTSGTTPEPVDQDDSHLHYNLGIACYEMDLIDKAIKEFVKAADQEAKTVESLFMLSKCYCRKGLFNNAAGFIDQALKLDTLTQQQIDMLNEQLKEIKARSISDSPSPLKRSDS